LKETNNKTSNNLKDLYDKTIYDNNYDKKWRWPSGRVFILAFESDQRLQTSTHCLPAKHSAIWEGVR